MTVVRPRALLPSWVVLCHPLNPHVELAGPFGRKTTEEDIDLPLLGLLPQSTAENAAINLRSPWLYVMAKFSVPAR